MRETLQNTVTKIKEKLENYLSQSNNAIKINEKINKGIKKLEKDEKNMLKHLTYVSKINKTIKQMKALFNEQMKNINISYEEQKNSIKYEEYLFSGIPIIPLSEHKFISPSRLNLIWSIDKINNNINYDKKNAKFKVEMKKAKENFKTVYEGSENNCTINNLSIKTEYEFRICSIYNDSFGPFSGIKTIKTSEIDSNILAQFIPVYHPRQKK